MRAIVSFIFYLFLVFSLNSQERETVTICWDSSLSIGETQRIQNIEILQQYFLDNKNIDIELLVFSNEIQSKEYFDISNGEWSELRKSLLNVIYDGSTSYQSILDQQIETDEILVFTDGGESLLPSKLNFKKPTTIYCSSPFCKKGFKNQLGSSITVISDVSNNKSFNDISNTVREKVKGKVVSNYGPVGDIEVMNLTTGETTLTTLKGIYELRVALNDTLRFISKGFESFDRPISQIDSLLDLSASGNTLREVILIGKPKSVEIEEIVLVGDKALDKRKLGYDVKTLDEDEISTNNVGLGTAIKGKIAGVEVGFNNDISATIIRGWNTINGNSHPLLVIDGVPLPRSNLNKDSSGNILGGGALDIIDPNNVKSVSVLKGLAATNRYGSEGNSGAILITTKTGSINSSTGKKAIVLGTTSTYTNEAYIMDSDLPEMTRALKPSQNIEEAYSVYLKIRENNINNYQFYVHAARYFSGWGNNFLTARVLSNSLEVSNGDPASLRAIAYEYESLGYLNEAINIYTKLIKDNPDHLQNYRDVALLYRKNGNINGAFEAYLTCQNILLDKPISQLIGFEKAIISEFKSFLSVNGSLVNTNLVDKKFVGTKILFRRVVFQWNDFDSQFNLQIVNPQKRYFTWEHTKVADANRLKLDELNGFGVEEYFLTASDKGQWIFNIENLSAKIYSNKGITFKITVFEDFGTAKEKQTVRVVNISELNKSTTVLKISI